MTIEINNTEAIGKVEVELTQVVDRLRLLSMQVHMPDGDKLLTPIVRISWQLGYIDTEDKFIHVETKHKKLVGQEALRALTKPCNDGVIGTEVERVVAELTGD